MMSAQRLVIFGAGGFGAEVAWIAESLAETGEKLQVVGFADDKPALHGQTLYGYKVLPLEEARSTLSADVFVIALGSARMREKLVGRALGEKLEPRTLIHPRVERSRLIRMSEGVVVCPGCILSTNVEIGAYAQLNLDCTISHDVALADFATLAPGVHVSGNVKLGRRSQIGTGANIINGVPGKPIVVGDDAVVGAGACVTRSVAAGVTVVGVPAKELTR